MKITIKILCALMAVMLVASAFGCAAKIESDLEGVISSGEFEKLLDGTPDELVKGQKIVGFGSYGGVELNWTVMDVDREGVALLLCDNVIDAKQFNNVRAISHVRDNETPDRYDELKADLEKRLGIDITRVEVGAVDFLTDMTMLRVFYKDPDKKIKPVDRIFKIPQDNVF